MDNYYLMSNKKTFIGKNINSLYKNEKVKETWVSFNSGLFLTCSNVTQVSLTFSFL